MATLHHGDCLEVLRGMADASVDAIVTDPPYGLSFMGKKWDYDVPSEDIWRECLRVLKPGGHLLAFAGTRTQHRMAVRIEDAGFEIRDMIAWVYGSGFPKSLDVSKAIDKAAGAEREVVGKMKNPATPRKGTFNCSFSEAKITAPATHAARQWQGWGTALKPALEPITVARKPLTGTVAANVLAHGTGGLNVDGCRVGIDSSERSVIDTRSGAGFGTIQCEHAGRETGERFKSHAQGRWPANVIHDGSDEVVGLFPQAGGGNGLPIHAGDFGKNGRYGKASGAVTQSYADSGSAARFFYCAKASKADRDEGCEGLDEKTKKVSVIQTEGVGMHGHSEDGKQISKAKNNHPTVKPTALMRYLCRLVTPPRGIVLDPFMGSGSTGKAATLEGFQFIGIEREEEYIKIAKARIDAVYVQPDLFAA